jgi:hypothetical protein
MVARVAAARVRTTVALVARRRPRRMPTRRVRGGDGEARWRRTAMSRAREKRRKRGSWMK